VASKRVERPFQAAKAIVVQLAQDQLIAVQRKQGLVIELAQQLSTTGGYCVYCLGNQHQPIVSE
jgi:urease accessory protein UreE